MKVAIICVLVLASLANGQDVGTGIREASDDELGFRSRVQFCVPGSWKMDDCNPCLCIEDGSAWGCTEMACPSVRPIGKPLDHAEQELGPENQNEIIDPDLTLESITTPEPALKTDLDCVAS